MWPDASVKYSHNNKRKHHFHHRKSFHALLLLVIRTTLRVVGMDQNVGFKPILTQTMPTAGTMTIVLQFLQHRRQRLGKLAIIKLKVLVDQVPFEIKAAVVTIDFKIAHQSRELTLEPSRKSVNFLMAPKIQKIGFPTLRTCLLIIKNHVHQRGVGAGIHIHESGKIGIRFGLRYWWRNRQLMINMRRHKPCWRH